MPTTQTTQPRGARRVSRQPDSPATRKQLVFINKLLAERKVDPTGGKSVSDLRFEAQGLNRKQASAWIERLKGLPHLTAEPAVVQPALALDWTPVPDGRYAVNVTDGELEFFRIKRGRHSVFVDRQASDEYWPIKSATRKAAILAAIVRDTPEAASVRYGKELGKCGVCGRTLTDHESRARGIGPKCARLQGWG